MHYIINIANILIQGRSVLSPSEDAAPQNFNATVAIAFDAWEDAQKRGMAYQANVDVNNELQGFLGNALKEAATKLGYDPEAFEVAIVGLYACGMAVKGTIPVFGILRFVACLPAKTNPQQLKSKQEKILRAIHKALKDGGVCKEDVFIRQRAWPMTAETSIVLPSTGESVKVAFCADPEIHLMEQEKIEELKVEFGEVLVFVVTMVQRIVQAWDMLHCRKGGLPARAFVPMTVALFRILELSASSARPSNCDLLLRFLDLYANFDPTTQVVAFCGRIAERSECEATFKKNTHGNQQVFRCASIYEPEEDVCGTYFEPSRIFGIFGTMADRIREAGLPLERSTKDLATFERDRAMIESLVDKAVPIQDPLYQAPASGQPAASSSAPASPDESPPVPLVSQASTAAKAVKTLPAHPAAPAEKPPCGSQAADVVPSAEPAAASKATGRDSISSEAPGAKSQDQDKGGYAES